MLLKAQDQIQELFFIIQKKNRSYNKTEIISDKAVLTDIVHKQHSGSTGTDHEKIEQQMQRIPPCDLSLKSK